MAMSEISIHTGTMGACNKINVVWFDENMVHKITTIEAEIGNWDKPRTLIIKIDGKQIMQTPPLPEKWCEHVATSGSGQYCYNGMDTRHWQYCPKCGKAKPSNEKVSDAPH